MDAVLVLIFLAMAATVMAMSLGLLAMSGGGATDRWLSTPLMWIRVGCQALTVVFLVVAALLR